jgi:hypothetical protein
MIIGTKVWNKGSSAPGSWTSIDFLTFYARISREVYDESRALDGTEETWRKSRYKVSITVGPLCMNNSTYRSALETLLDSYYIRFKDTRFSYLGDTNTINFVHSGGTDYTRKRASLITEDTVLEFKAESWI